MPMTSTQFLALHEPGLNTIWHEAEEPVDLQYSKIFNIDTMKKATEQDLRMAGFPGLQTQTDGGELVYADALIGGQKAYTYVVRALGYVVTDRLVRDDQYGQVQKFERDLMRAALDDQELFAFGLLRNATNTTVSSGFDALALASTAHTRLDGGATQANRPTSVGALSLANLHTGVIQFRKWLNDRGRPVRGKPKYLVIPPDLELTAIEILQSTDRPDTANRATNAITRWGLEPIVVQEYLSSTTFWALVGEKHDLNFKWYFKPETGSETEFGTDNIKRKVRQAMGRGHGMWFNFYLGNT